MNLMIVLPFVVAVRICVASGGVNGVTEQMRFARRNVAQSLDVGELNVVKLCIIVLLKVPILGDASSLKGAPGV
jgi:hypothetical protein